MLPLVLKLRGDRVNSVSTTRAFPSGFVRLVYQSKSVSLVCRHLFPRLIIHRVRYIMPLTPAYGFREYSELSHKELKEILMQRGLSNHGSKSKKIGRLARYDEEQ